MSTNTPRILAIVRHGETDWNSARRIQGRTEVPLNATGRAQAAAAGQLLHNQPGQHWSGLYSSTLGRAVETAQIIGEVLALGEPKLDPNLLERHFGSAEGELVADAMQRWPGLEVPDAEPLDALAVRAAGAFDRLLNEASGSVVVAHGAMIRVGLSELTGTEVPRVLNGEVWLLSRSGTGQAPQLSSLGVAYPAS